MNITELKAKAYDLLAQIEYIQVELQKVNRQIAEEHQKNGNGTTTKEDK